ncbi:Ribonuclease VapC22 [Brevundimonas sp. NIBR10]|uniref:type II toxin-antitoxin system VapC family toxin n=1 Tax=Brevundimonas sp. NIBR10 TaxID=3015997 RepID=UPI0022F197CD|nr:PIN domain-containing protein [Brevundimonas sp. NIBR10]WGM46611.1 Ribonuclease VapC22 [Brevundimonas sp. NIBR10]
MSQLDTHIVVWLYEGRASKLSKAARNLIRRSDTVTISPLTLMELDNLIAGRRVKAESPATIIAIISQEIGPIDVSPTPFQDIIAKALTIGWTRDPFDRLIVANAMADGVKLITADEKIRANFKDAVWD